MDVQTYLKQRARLAQAPARRQRDLCITCLQPRSTCYCHVVRSFDPGMKFVILIHRLEVRRRIATGRMSHLCLHNSELIMGYDYSNNEVLNSILQNPEFYPVILYPGKLSANLSQMDEQQRAVIFPAEKKPVILVIDGTWSTAKKMLRRSRNLHHLPRICFTPTRPSSFRVRRQPKPECFSTVEAIHQVIEMLGPSQGLDLSQRPQDRLLQVFDHMVEQQLAFVRESRARNTHSRHRRSV